MSRIGNQLFLSLLSASTVFLISNDLTAAGVKIMPFHIVESNDGIVDPHSLGLHFQQFTKANGDWTSFFVETRARLFSSHHEGGGNTEQYTSVELKISYIDLQNHNANDTTFFDPNIDKIKAFVHVDGLYDLRRGDVFDNPRDGLPKDQFLELTRDGKGSSSFTGHMNFILTGKKISPDSEGDAPLILKTISIAFTDGQGRWDSNGGKNYKIKLNVTSEGIVDNSL